MAKKSTKYTEVEIEQQSDLVDDYSMYFANEETDFFQFMIENRFFRNPQTYKDYIDRIRYVSSFFRIDKTFDETKLDKIRNYLVKTIEKRDPNIDKLFDKGYITFDKNGGIVCSKRISAEDKRIFGIDDNCHLMRIEDKHVPYLKYHHDNCFLG